MLYEIGACRVEMGVNPIPVRPSQISVSSQSVEERIKTGLCCGDGVFFPTDSFKLLTFQGTESLEAERKAQSQMFCCPHG
jgi:hypothetical protein